MPMQDLDQLMLDLFLEKYNGQVSWEHKVTGLGQDENKAWVDVETPQGNTKVEADYIIGCDGANSQIRKSLFGNEYPGFTWDAQIVATNVSAVRIPSLYSAMLTEVRPTTISKRSLAGQMLISSFILSISM